MTGEPGKWEKIAPRRLEATLDELRKLARTGGKDYDPIPEEHAEEMLRLLHEGMDGVVQAYSRVLGAQELYLLTSTEADRPAPSPVAEPVPAQEIREVNPLDNPNAIAFFINRIPKEHLPAWAAHLSTRICDEFYDRPS